MRDALAPVRRLQEEHGLTELQARFVQEYPACDFNAAEAARRAGYSEKTAREIGHENLTKPHIQAALSGYLEKLTERSEIRAEDVLEEYRRLAFSNIADVLEWDREGRVSVRSTDELPREVTAAIKKLKWREHSSEDGGTTRRLEVELHDKARAMDKLGQFLELWKDRTDVRVELFQYFATLPPDELRRIVEMDDDEIVEMFESRGGGPGALPRSA